MSDSPSGRIPVVGVLGRGERILLGATLAVAALALAAEFMLRLDAVVVFVLAGIAILGLAWVIGLATERLGALSGPHVGGVLNATFGNVAELIIAFFALQAGLIEVVKASITGSIIGNLLAVLGAAVLVGGLQHGHQRFDRRVASSTAALLVLAAVGLLVPAVFAATAPNGTASTITEESVLVSIVLIGGYVLALVYQFRHPAETLGGHEPVGGHGGPPWRARTAVGVLLAATVILAVLSEVLVGAIEPFVEAFGLSTFFVGVVLIPIIGNLAEHLVAVQLARRDQMEFSMAVTFGSSLQVALFVGPALVILGVLMGQPMNLVFLPLEVVAVATAVGISALIAFDGESNWLEGALLLGVYLILAVSFFELR